jgi:hypothetical protein
LDIGKQLEDIAEQTGGRINHNPSFVLKILSLHDKKIEELFKAVPRASDLNHALLNSMSEKEKIY